MELEAEVEVEGGAEVTGAEDQPGDISLITNFYYTITVSFSGLKF